MIILHHICTNLAKRFIVQLNRIVNFNVTLNFRVFSLSDSITDQVKKTSLAATRRSHYKECLFGIRLATLLLQNLSPLILVDSLLSSFPGFFPGRLDFHLVFNIFPSDFDLISMLCYLCGRCLVDILDT